MRLRLCEAQPQNNQVLTGKARFPRSGAEAQFIGMILRLRPQVLP